MEKLDELLNKEIKKNKEYFPKISYEEAVKEFAKIKFKVSGKMKLPTNNDERNIIEELVSLIMYGRVYWDVVNRSVVYKFKNKLENGRDKISFKERNRKTMKDCEVSLATLLKDAENMKDEDMEKLCRAYSGETSEVFDLMTDNDLSNCLLISQLFLV